VSRDENNRACTTRTSAAGCGHQHKSNQSTLGNGCVCDSGCENCDALAEAYTATLKALRSCPTGYLGGIADGRAWLRQYAAALALAAKVEGRR